MLVAETVLPKGPASKAFGRKEISLLSINGELITKLCGLWRTWFVIARLQVYLDSCLARWRAEESQGHSSRPHSITQKQQQPER